MNNSQRLPAILLVVCLAVLLAGCAPGHERFSVGTQPAGFFWGVWHGWIAPFSLIAGFFRPAIRLYETHNTGWWYDLGFYLAVVGGFGSLSFARRKRDRD